MSELTENDGSIAIDTLNQALSDIREANKAMSSRVCFVFGASSALVTAGTAVGAATETSLIGSVAVLVLSVLGLLLVFLANGVWQARLVFVVSPDSPEETYSDYVNVTLDDAYGARVQDLHYLIEQESNENGFIADRLWWMVVVLDFQILSMMALSFG